MFVQPWMLYALPLIAVPIIIHLINQRRFQTVQWAAMRFLLMANRMSRGYARIRQWLILLARTLAIAGLILAISRPLSSGWLSLAAGSKVDTTLILLDRSPSMSQQGVSGGQSKLQTGLDQLVQSLGMLESNHYVLIDSTSNSPLNLESPAALQTLPQASAASASTDLPAMLQSAYDYIEANKPSRTEIWICSDVRQHDWDAESGRWQVLRDSFLEFQLPVRFHLLAYPGTAPQNRSIRVTEARRVESTAGVELLLSLEIEQPDPVDVKTEIPIQLELEGVRSTLHVELTGTATELKNHAIQLDASQQRGWGRVSIPADANPADNEFYFVFDQPTDRKTIVVAENPESIAPLQLAAAIPPAPDIKCLTEVISASQLDSVEWDEVALVIWQDQLPQAAEADLLNAYIARGGEVVFFPPNAPSENAFANVHWDDWQNLDEETPVSSWLGDEDLLANTKSGASLPVGQLRVMRYCELSGEQIPLASLSNGAPLLCRALTDQRSVYFCTTTATVGESSLARDGVVLYVMLQRALARGAESLGTTRQLEAARQPETAAVAEWKPLSDSEALSTDYDVHAGVYARDEQMFAINRSLAEDRATILADQQVAQLFDQLDFDRVDDSAGSGASLIQEIWRLFLVLMMSALIAEAFLCLPRKNRHEEEPHKQGWDRSEKAKPAEYPWGKSAARQQEVSA